MKEREERDRGIRAVVEVGEEPIRRKLDLEEHHDREEAEIHIIPLMSLTRVSKNWSDVSGSLAWDDLTGMKLSADKVIEARGKEIQYVKDMGVWHKIPRRTEQARGWKIIKTRWIGINKGDDANPIYRSRLVGK